MKDYFALFTQENFSQKPLGDKPPLPSIVCIDGNGGLLDKRLRENSSTWALPTSETKMLSAESTPDDGDVFTPLAGVETGRSCPTCQNPMLTDGKRLTWCDVPRHFVEQLPRRFNQETNLN